MTNRAARFDVFHAIATGRDTNDRPSNAEIKKRNLAAYAADCEKEKREQADAAALAERDAKEKALGITNVMNARRAADAKRAEKITRVYNSDFEAFGIHAEDRGEYAIDVFHQMVLQDAPSDSSPEDVEKAAESFFAILEDEGTILSDDDKRRILIYVGLHGVALADKNIFIDPLSNGTWRGALARLEEMGAVHPKRQPRTEPKPLEITDSSDAAHDRQVVDDDFIDQTGGWITAWADSVEKGFGIRMTTAQKRAALDYIVARNLPWSVHESWDKARKYLANAGVLVCSDGTLPLTEREVIEQKMDKLDISNPSQRQEYFRLANYLNHSF